MGGTGGFRLKRKGIHRQKIEKTKQVGRETSEMFLHGGGPLGAFDAPPVKEKTHNVERKD